MPLPPPSPPKEFLDTHHHFLDTTKNSFQSFVHSLAPDGICCLPSDYQGDVLEPLRRAGITLVGSVHVECMPDNGLDEVAWVESLAREDASAVKAIVASCDLTSPTADQELARLKQTSAKVRGIRWILDCVGNFEGGNTATHVGTSRHDGMDYLRGSHGGYDGDVVPAFERGFSLLEQHGLSFDLQCAPVQLKAAAALCARYPKIGVCIDHLGKPRMLLGPDDERNDNTIPDETELTTWREGMKALAALPNVHVKLSMLGYCIPGWSNNVARTALLRTVIREMVALFGPKRCMVATNWWKNAALSDSDGLSAVGPDPVQLVTWLSEILSDYSQEDRNSIFCGTARAFYKID
jgi:predicted TIM-barrel fold metal-dependent hydrolase